MVYAVLTLFSVLEMDPQKLTPGNEELELGAADAEVELAAVGSEIELAAVDSEIGLIVVSGSEATDILVECLVALMTVA